MISVCMATFNGAKYIRPQLESILSQLGEDDEVIVSDDSSTDNTLEIVKSFKDSRIKIFINNSSPGVNNNFNNSLSHAKGDYIFLSDQDDVWLPGKVTECVKVLKQYDCVVHDAYLVDENLKIIKNSFFEFKNSGSGFIKNLIINTYTGGCMALKKEVLLVCLPIPNTSSFFHDIWIGALSDLKFKTKFIDFKGILFRRHSEASSCSGSKSKFTRKQQFINRYRLIIEILKRLLRK